MRLEKAKEFLAEGDRVQVEIILRGRERQFIDLARQIIDKFVADMDAAVRTIAGSARSIGITVEG